MAQSDQGLEGIQVLRWFAASSVVFAHIDISKFVVDPGALGVFGIGVDVFFCISGFIMMYLVETRPDRASVFLARRFSRIFPLYFISTLVILALAYALTQGYLTESVIYFYPPQKLNIDWFLESVFFVGLSRPPINGIGWSLQFEAFFYICIAIIIFSKVKSKILFLFFVFLFGNLLKYFGSGLSIFWSPFLIEFMFGMICYRFWRANLFSTSLIVIPCIIIFLFGAFFWKYSYSSNISPEWWRAFTAGLAGSAALVGSLVVAEKYKIPKCLIRLGDRSYALYLTHWVFMPIVCYFLAPYLSGYLIIYIAAIFVFFQTISVLVTRYIDTPAHNFVLNWFLVKLR